MKNNAWPVFIIPFSVELSSNTVSYWGEYHAVLRDLASASGCTVIDFVPLLQEKDDLSLLFFDECHPTEEGNKMLAGYILESLQEKLEN